MPPLIPKMDVFQFFEWKLDVLQGFPLLPRTGMVAFVVGGSKYGENIHFPWFFIGLGMPPLIPKMDVFQFFGWKLHVLQGFPLLPRTGMVPWWW